MVIRLAHVDRSLQRPTAPSRSRRRRRQEAFREVAAGIEPERAVLEQVSHTARILVRVRFFVLRVEFEEIDVLFAFSAPDDPVLH